MSLLTPPYLNDMFLRLKETYTHSQINYPMYHHHYYFQVPPQVSHRQYRVFFSIMAESLPSQQCNIRQTFAKENCGKE